MDSAQMVEEGTILRATVGSTVHGLHHGGQDDRDEMAVYIEPPAYLVGLARARGIRGGLYGFEHYVERTQPEGVRSGPGDLDLVAYSLRKYVRLALKGHPTILLLLFVPDELIVAKTEPRRRAPRAAARDALATGRPRLPRLPARPEGAAARLARTEERQPARARRGARLRHEVRDARRPLGIQGIELLETGRRHAAHAGARPSRVMAIRTGERSFEEAIAEIDELEQRLAEALERSSLRDEPDRGRSTHSSSRRTARLGLAGGLSAAASPRPALNLPP